MLAPLILAACATTPTASTPGGVPLVELSASEGRPGREADGFKGALVFRELALCDAPIRKAGAAWATRFGLAVEKDEANRSREGTNGRAVLWADQERGWFELSYAYAPDRTRATVLLSFFPKEQRVLPASFSDDVRRMYDVKKLMGALEHALGCPGAAVPAGK